MEDQERWRQVEERDTGGREEPAVERTRQVRVTAQGSLVKAQVEGVLCGREVSWKRGVVRGFSQASRRRMLELVATLDLPGGCVGAFISLTYGTEYPCPRCAKEDLRVFLRRVERYFGQWIDDGGRVRRVAVIWRLEWQARGAPHFHVVAFCPFLGKDLVARWWSEIAGRALAEEQRASIEAHGTSVSAVYGRRGAFRYVAKYAAKVSRLGPEHLAGDGDGSPVAAPGRCGPCGLDYLSYWDKPGRFWGVEGRKWLPVAEGHELVFPLGRWFHKLRRTARHVYPRRERRKWAGFTLYRDDIAAWLVAAAYWWNDTGREEHPEAEVVGRCIPARLQKAEGDGSAESGEKVNDADGRNDAEETSG